VRDLGIVQRADARSDLGQHWNHCDIRRMRVQRRPGASIAASRSSAERVSPNS